MATGKPRGIAGNETDASKINVEQVLLNLLASLPAAQKPQEIVQYIDFFKAKRLRDAGMRY